MTQLFESTNTTALEQELETLVEQAHETCDTNGGESKECAAVWDAAEEIQATIADHKANKTTLETYCDNNPGASECLIYDV